MSKHDLPESAPTSDQQSQFGAADWPGMRRRISDALGADDAEILGFALDGKPITGGTIPIPGNVRLGGEWPPEHNELLRQLWNEKKYSASQIASVIGGVTRNAVIGRARRMGLDTRTTSPTGKPPTDRRHKPRLAPHRIPRMIEADDKPMAPIVPPARPLPPGKPVPFFDLRPEHCRWPLWTDDHPELLFCGAVKEETSSYCPRHARKAFVGRGRD